MDVAIVGNGICGITAAKVISEISPKEKITIFAQEQYHYYPRPRLIQLLSQKADLSQLFPYGEDWFKSRAIKVSLGEKVEAIDASSKELSLKDSARHKFDRLLLATGSIPFIPPIDGSSAEGVFVLRTINDVLRIRRYSRDAESPASRHGASDKGRVIRHSEKAVVIGGGLLGIETARALSALGLKVAVVEVASRLLPRQLDEEGAAILRSQIERLGIGVVLGATCERILTGAAKGCLLLKGGGKLEADLFVISAGIRSNIALAKDSGISFNKGIIADKNLRTNLSDVFAAGDCAEFNGTVYGIIPAAIEQARVAAENIVGRQSEYRGTLPQTTLKVAGIDLTSVGVVNPEGEGYDVVKRKDAARNIYRKLVVKDGRLVGAIILGDKRTLVELTKIIQSGVDVSRNKDALLGDEDTLKEVFLSGG